MIRVQVREEHGLDAGDGARMDLVQADGGASAAVEQQQPLIRLNEDGRSKSIG